MKSNSFIRTTLLILSVSVLAACAEIQTTGAADPLPSWTDGEKRSRIIQFVETVTDPQNADFFPANERVAVFDNDGTLWGETPVYFQIYFAIDRVKAMASDHPEWADTQPFKAVLENDMQALAALGEHGLMEFMLTTHGGMTAEEFDGLVAGWLQTATHPQTKRLYTQMVYQPMLELLNFLRANGFQTWIVSGGGIAFMRPWVEAVYGIPPEQVVGSSIVTGFELRDGEPTIVRENKIDFINDKAGKPLGINKHIGRRPIAAFGNSDGDLQMLQYTAAGDGERLMMLVHHTDAERESAYDRNSHIGRLDKALDIAVDKNWLVVDMAKDWRVIYPYQLVE